MLKLKIIHVPFDCKLCNSLGQATTMYMYVFSLCPILNNTYDVGKNDNS
jgi:hypothetical protein